MDAYKNVAGYTELSSIGIIAKKLARITNARSTRLHVECGAVWITEDRSEQDVLLHAGESYCIKRDGLTIVSTLNVPFALVTMEPSIPVTPTMRERFWNFWAGLYVPESRPTTAAL